MEVPGAQAEHSEAPAARHRPTPAPHQRPIDSCPGLRLQNHMSRMLVSDDFVFSDGFARLLTPSPFLSLKCSFHLINAYDKRHRQTTSFLAESTDQTSRCRSLGCTPNTLKPLPPGTAPRPAPFNLVFGGLSITSPYPTLPRSCICIPRLASQYR